jgi:type IV pilus assembly protein PilP
MTSRHATLAAFAALTMLACSAEKVLQQANNGPAGAATATATASASAAAAPAPPPIGKVDFGENDFVESDRNRDPFRSFATLFAPTEKKAKNERQLAIILPQYSLDELKLVAIVGGGDYPRAMVIDPQGKGWVLKRGDWIGRPEIVHTGGANGSDYELNWRVDKVRDGDIVFSREDPANPGIPPATRVISLHPESEQKTTALD